MSSVIVTKQGKNNGTNPDYYIGLDIGSNSVGWAVTDKQYNLLHMEGKNGKDMWGVRLFDEAQSADTRRTKRSIRRRSRREKVRLNLLKELFRKQIEALDPKFFIRLANSSTYVIKDENGSRTLGSRIEFSNDNGIELFGKNKRMHIFEGEGITDNEFYNAFPTIYHLRSALIKGDEVKYVTKGDDTPKTLDVKKLYDPRLLYLALYSELKHRGHFLFGDIDLDKYLSGAGLEDNIKKIMEFLELEPTSPIDYNLVKKIYKNQYKVVEEIVGDDGSKQKRERTLRLKTEKNNELKKLITVMACNDSDYNDDEKKDIKDFFYNLLKLSLGMSLTIKSKDDDSLFANFTEDVKLDFNDSDKIEKNIITVKEAYEPFGIALEYAYNVYLWALLVEILKEERYLSIAKIKSYEQHAKDLKWLKDTVRYLLKNEDETTSKEKYLSIFGNDTSSFTYEVYVHHGKKADDKKATSLQNFIAHINKVLSHGSNNKPLDNYINDVIDDKIKCSNNYTKEEIQNIKRRIEDGKFLPLQRRGEDVALPNVVINNEYNAILDKASNYLMWLKEEDKSKFSNDGSNLTPIDKIKSLIGFRIPYYVGPLAYKKDITDENDLNKWVVRNEGYENKQILPWEFDKAINKSKTREKFIKRMLSRCTYIPTCYVLPKCSLLYQKYLVLSELNNLNLEINGDRVDYSSKFGIEIKQGLYNECFIKGKTGNKSLKEFIANFINERYPSAEKVHWNRIDFDLGGDDDNNKFKSSLSSYIALKDINLSDEQKEKIIELYTIFGKETNEVEAELGKYNWYNGLDKNSKDIIRNKMSNVTGWGKLSREFLEEITISTKDTSENKNIINSLYDTNYHLNELLYGIGEYPPFNDAIDTYNYEHLEEYKKEYNIKRTNALNIKNISYNDVKDEYMPFTSKRATWQAIRIVKEIVGIMGKSPKKIFIETIRSDDKEKKGKRTKSRYTQLEEKLKNIAKITTGYNAKDYNVDINKLKNELKTQQYNLSSDRLYLYFSQCGKSLYTGDPIDIDAINAKGYDKDHIYPRSQTNDDSLIDNLVLVESELNRDKSANTLKSVVSKYNVKKIVEFWEFLYKKEFISKEKYNRLKYSLKNDYLGNDILEYFKNKQLVSTSQSTKVVKDLLTKAFSEFDEKGKRTTEIVFSKAKLVSEFRDNFGMYKNRDINDAHHAKDAYLNIVVGNVYNTEFTHDYWKHFDKISDDESHNITAKKVYGRDIGSDDNIAWRKDTTINTVKNTMHKNDILLTRMQTTGKGALFDESIYSLVKQESEREIGEDKPKKRKANIEDVPLKEGVIAVKNNDIHYGFYNKISIAYFTLVKELESKKQQIKIECIPIWYLNRHKDMTSYDIAKNYCTLSKKEGGLGYKNIEVLIPKLKIKSLVCFKKEGEFFGYISGKTGNSITLNISNILNFGEFEPYAIQIFKFLEKRKKFENYTIDMFNRRGELKDNREREERERNRPVITRERNLDLYDYLIAIHKKGEFINRPSGQLERFILGRALFQSDDISIEEQVKLLSEIINYFNGSTADLSLIDGSSNSGLLSISRSVTNGVSVINQSVTGLFNNSVIFENESK